MHPFLTRFKSTVLGQIISSVSILSLVLSPIAALTPSFASAATVFSDGFESNNFSAWSSVDDQWDTTSFGEHSGNYAAEVSGNTGSQDDELRKNISTSGQSSIVLSYWYRADDLESSDNDEVLVQYSTNGGSSWTTLFTISDANDDDSWHQNTHSLPASAANNTNFRFRFLADLSGTSDVVKIDDVLLSASAGDTTAPTVTNVTSSTANGSYNAGDVVNVQVTFSEVVLVTGTPRITLETGATDRNVNYTSGSNSTTLTFAYTVQAGDTSADLDYTGTTALTLNGGTIRDAANNNAVLTLATPGAANSLGANKAIVIDTTAPTISQVTPVPTPTNDATPNYTFSSNEAGTIAYAGGCTSGTASAVNGNNTLTFASLADGTYASCTVKVTDAAGNQSNTLSVSSFTVDTVAPVITITGDNPMALGTGDTYTEQGATALDANDGSVAANPSGSVNTAVPGTYNITYTATDAAGNSSSAVRAVNVSDDDAPNFSGVPANMTVEATSVSGATVTYTNPGASDNVDGDVSANVVCTPASGSTFAFDTTVVGCSVSDAAGNNAATSFTVTVEDTTDPVLTMPANQTLEATSSSGAVATFTVAATDNIDGDVSSSIVCDALSGNTFALGITTVNCTAEDNAGNVGSGSFNVTVQDTTAPVITFEPSAIVVVTVSETESEALYIATVVDAGDAAPSLSCSPASGSVFPAGVSTVTCSATDASGNSATESTTVTITTTPVTGGGTDASPFEVIAPVPEEDAQTQQPTTNAPEPEATNSESVVEPEGEVLGASCVQLNSYVGMGNDKTEDVLLVQEFLNKELGLTLEANGSFDSATKEAVKMFQLKYIADILAPWIPFGHDGKTPTGIVYKTTQYKMNVLSCPGLDIQMPQLP